jgi:HEAT repeat protein
MLNRFRLSALVVTLAVLLATATTAYAQTSRESLLISTLNSEQNAWTRQGAAYQLGQQKNADKAIYQALEYAVNDRDWAVAYESTRALLNLGKNAASLSGASDRFLKGLSNPEAEIRILSAKAMLLLRSPTSVIRKRLINALRDRNKDVARMSLLALASSREPTVQHYILNALDSTDWETRQAAAKAIGLYSDIKLGDELAISLQDPVQAVRWAALQSLINLGPTQAEHIALALKDQDASIRKLAQQTLLKYQESGMFRTVSIER